MNTPIRLAGLALTAFAITLAHSQDIGGPDTVIVQSGSLELHALLWHPRGEGPSPAVLFNPSS